MPAKKSSSKRSSSKKSSSKKSSSSRSLKSRSSDSSRGKSSSGKSRSKSSSRRKYGPKAQRMVETEMRHFKRGEHKSPKQAIAIGLSKARRAGGKVPPRKKAA